MKRLRPVLVGAVLAVPVLVVFLGLFASADAVFADYVDSVFSVRIGLGDEIPHLIVIVLLGIGILGTWALGITRPASRTLELPRPSLPAGSAVTLLGLVVALFATFVLVQFAYLFSGDAVVRGGYTYAEYARRGFFELVLVAGLVLGLLLVVDWLVQSGPTRNRTVDLLAAALIVCTYVVVASGLRRMALYVDEFGLTELRLYTTAFMLWTAIVLTWFLATVLRSDRSRFGAGVVAASVLVVLGLNIVNPDAFIARVDLDRDVAGERQLDAGYVASLGADAVPVLTESAALAQCEVVSELAVLRAELDLVADEEGWRGLTLADRSARSSLRSPEFDAALARCR